MSGDKSSLLPAEDMGQLAALKLLETIGQSGVCDQVAQPLVILFAALNPGSVSKVLCGQLTPYSVELLRHMKTFLGVTFRLEQVDEGMTFLRFFKNFKKNIFSIKKWRAKSETDLHWRWHSEFGEEDFVKWLENEDEYRLFHFSEKLIIKKMLSVEFRKT